MPLRRNLDGVRAAGRRASDQQPLDNVRLRRLRRIACLCACVCVCSTVCGVFVLCVCLCVCSFEWLPLCAVCVSWRLCGVRRSREEGGGGREGGARDGRGGWVSGVGRSDGGGRAREQAAAARESRLQEGAQLQGRRVKRAEAAGGDF